MKKIVLLALLLVSANAYAARLLPINFSGQIVLHVDEGNASACGVRFLGVEDPSNPQNLAEKLWIPDGSIMIDRRMYGLAKALIYQTTVKGLLEKSVNTQGFEITNFWFKVPGQKGISPLLGVNDGETPNSKLYVTDGAVALDLITAILRGEKIQFAVDLKSGDSIAFYGSVMLTKADAEQLLTCLEELKAN